MISVPEIKIIINSEQSNLANKMTSQINNSDCKAVSFRMMNTLVCTPFSEIYDLFLLMEEDFKKFYKGRKRFYELRIYAESKFPKDITKIYDFIMKQSKISQQERDILLESECRLIEEFVYPRSFGKKLFNEAKKHRKKIIIVADTVYPRSTVVNILEKCGYADYKELIITHELESDDIYDTVIEKSKVSCSKIVSIGGDVAEDVEKPILKGSKALLMADTVPLMLKSGRLRSFIQAKHLYNYDTADFFALHLAFGLYSSYMFDLPRNKVYQSDFCASPYMLGFIVFGTLRLDKNFTPDNFQQEIISASEKNDEIMRGTEDFISLFSAHFGKIADNLQYKGFSLPFEFYFNHGADTDRNFLSEFLAPDILDKWTKSIKEPVLAPVRMNEKQNRISTLADKMFPPGTKVRIITDNILAKMKQKIKL